MSNRPVWSSGFTLVLLLLSSPAWSAEVVGKLVNGNRVEGDKLQDWHETKAQPHLSGQKLFDQQQPFQWVLQTAQPVPPVPQAYVELVGGDRLPGTVQEYRPGNESPYRQLPPHLVVKPLVELNWPDHEFAKLIRVETRWIQRVVWESQSVRDYRPGTLFLRDGREIPFRTLRWGSHNVSALLDDGTQSFPFFHISEIHFPRQDGWRAYLEQLAVLTPDCSSRLLELETSHGVKALASLERFQANRRGDHTKPENWYHLVQPAWSLDPLWVPYRTVRAYRFFNPNQIPLTRLTPEKIEQNSTFGSAWRWQINQSSQQKPLKSNDQDFGWGLGVHANHQLTYELPPLARSFRVQMGIDHTSGSGGCVQAMIDLDGQRLLQSEVLVGSTRVQDSGHLSLPAPQNEQPRLLTLTVDSVHQNRPSGADPFDIRDSFNWLEPLIELDSEQLKQQVRNLGLRGLGPLEDWAVKTAPENSTVVNFWDDSVPQDPRFLLQMNVLPPFAQFTRRFRVGETQKWLSVAINRAQQEIRECRMLVTVNGTHAYELNLPQGRKGDELDPLMVPLRDFQGQVIDVTLTLQPDKEAALVEWRGVAPVEQPPWLIQLFEDDLEFAQKFPAEEGTVRVIHEDAFSGAASLEVTRAQPKRANIDGWDYPVRSNPRLGEFRYFRFAWRKQGEKMIGLELGHNGEFGSPGEELGVKRPRNNRGPQLTRVSTFNPRQVVKEDLRGIQFGYRFDAGNQDMFYHKSMRRIEWGTPKEWKENIRDLFDDFGTFEITGLGLLCLDGDYALYDGIYLARRYEDFKQINRWYFDSVSEPKRPNDPPSLVSRIAREEEYAEIAEQVAPGFVVKNSYDGVWLLDSFGDRQSVMRVHAQNQTTPCILKRPLVIPENHSCLLECTVAADVADPKADWQLQVKVNGEMLQDTVIAHQQMPYSWHDIKVDLSRFAGKAVVIELVVAGKEWTNESAYFDRVAIQLKPN